MTLEENPRVLFRRNKLQHNGSFRNYLCVSDPEDPPAFKGSMLTSSTLEYSLAEALLPSGSQWSDADGVTYEVQGPDIEHGGEAQQFVPVFAGGRPVTETKRCSKCERVRPIDEYQSGGNGRKRSECRACRSKMNALWREKQRQ